MKEPQTITIIQQLPENVQTRIDTLKQRGNECFSRGQYAESLGLYTSALDVLRASLGLKPDTVFDADIGTQLPAAVSRVAAILLSNRANALLHMEMVLRALADATAAAAVDPGYAKAHFRRGTALLRLGRGAEALDDFRRAAFLCPADPSALDRVRECERFVQQQARARAAEDAEQAARRAIVASLGPMLLRPGTDLGPPDPARYRGPVLSAVPTVAEFGAVLDGFRRGERVHRHYVGQLLCQAMGILKMLPNVVAVDAPPGARVTVVGDVHGQFFDLLHILETAGMPGAAHQYVFNGDFVDRGAWGVEVAVTLLTLKCMYPRHVHLARGNHETASMNRTYGFAREAADKYGPTIAAMFTETFASLPLAHVLGGRVFVVHGGIAAHSSARDVASLDEIQAVDRFGQPPDGSLMCDLLWSDPQPQNGLAPSPRGVGHLFGPDVTRAFLARTGLRMVIRSHEAVGTGYSVVHDGCLATVFSAPNYCDVLGNDGAYATLTAPDMVPVYTTFKASPHPHVPSSSNWSFSNLFNF